MSEQNETPPIWQWSKKPSDGRPRMGWVHSAPLGDGSVFAVFGGTDGLYYGHADEKTGDPFFPGPLGVEGGDLDSEDDVERIAMAIFRAWIFGIGDGAGLAERKRAAK